MSDISTDKDEEKKGGGLPTWMTGSAKVGSGFGSGGTAAGGGLTRFLALLAAPKVIVAATVLGGLALGMGIVNTITPPKEPSLAQRFNKERAASMSASANLPGSEKQGESALNLAQKANSGFYQDPAAAAAAQAAADKEAVASVDAPADPAAKAGVKGADGAQPTPEQMAAAMGGQQNTKAGMGNKFGKLSAGLARAGSGLSGGSGLAGGIGGSFKQSGLTNSRAGDLRGFAGGNKATVASRKLSAAGAGKSALKGATAQRLDKMNRAMGNIGTSNADSAAAGHAQQWDAAAPTGSGITGAGASGPGAGGQFSGEEGTGGGGPLDTNSSGGTSAAPVKDVGQGANKTPYQNQLMMAQGLLMVASLLIIIVGVCAMMEKTPFTAWIASIKTALYVAAIGMAAAAAAIGATVGSQYGQAAQGQIIAVGGTLTAATAAIALIAPTTPSWLVVLGGIAGLAASCAAALKK